MSRNVQFVFECRLLSRFCHFAHAYPSTLVVVVVYMAGTLDIRIFYVRGGTLRCTRYFLGRPIWDFFLKPHTILRVGCITRIWVPFYRASSGTRFSALVARRKGGWREGKERSETGMARGRFGIFPPRKEKEFCRRFGNFISRLACSISVNVMK